MQKCVLIFSGFNQRAVIAYCRYAKVLEIPFYIIAKNHQDTILKTSFKKNVIFVRRNNNLEVELIIEISRKIEGKNQFLVLPTSEFLNRFLLNNRQVFEENNIFIPLCKKELYEEISDKKRFSEVCFRNSIKIPREFIINESVDYPCVIKPIKYQCSDSKIYKPQIIQNQTEFDAFFENKPRKDFFIQEFVGGKSFYLLFYFSKNGKYSLFSQENYLQQNNGGSMILAASTDIHEMSFSKDYAKLFLLKKFFGLIMIEVKYYQGSFYMIEANPRFWGPSQLIIDAEMDLFDLFSMDNNLINKAPQRNYKKEKWYFWSGGLIENQLKKKKVTVYDFNLDSFYSNYADILKSEIYFKEDSILIFKNENQIQ